MDHICSCYVENRITNNSTEHNISDLIFTVTFSLDVSRVEMPSETRIGCRVKYLLSLYDLDQNYFCQQISVELPNIKFNKTPFSNSRRQTGRERERDTWGG
jgi:hypothetical protein